MLFYLIVQSLNLWIIMVFNQLFHKKINCAASKIADWNKHAPRTLWSWGHGKSEGSPPVKGWISSMVAVAGTIIAVVLPVFATGVYPVIGFLGGLEFLGVVSHLCKGPLDLHGIGLALVHHQGQLMGGDVPAGILYPGHPQGGLFDARLAHFTFSVDLKGHFLVSLLGLAQNG